MVEIMKSDRSSERYEQLGNSGGNQQQMHPLSSANPPNLPRPPIHPSQQQQQQQQHHQQQQHNHHMVQQQQPQSAHPLQHNNHGLGPHNHNLSSIHLNSTPGTARASPNQQQANGGHSAKYEELVMSNSASTATNHHHHHHHHSNSPLQRPPPPMHHANGVAGSANGAYGMGSVTDTPIGSGAGITPGGNISANGVTVVNGQPPSSLEPGYAAEQENEKWWWVCCLEFCFCLL